MPDLRLLNGFSTRRRERAPRSHGQASPPDIGLRLIDCRPNLYDALERGSRRGWGRSAWPIVAGAAAAALCLLLVPLIG